MPLNEKLKSDMMGNAEDISKKATTENPVIQTENTLDFDTATSSPNPIFAVNEENEDKTIEQVRLLKSIESQLQGLEKSVCILGEVITEGKNTVFNDLFAKIEATRISVEKLISQDNSHLETEQEDYNKQVLSLLQSILEKQEKNDRHLTHTLRDNATFQIQVRQGMQQDLDRLKEEMAGEQFNPLLKEIASVYVEYQTLLEDDSISDRSRKNLEALFEDLADMLNDYDAEICRSEVGSVRQTRVCKVINKIPTDMEEKHNTIAASRRPGIVRNRSVLYSEFVDVYVFDPSLVEKKETKENMEVEEMTVEQESIGEITDATRIDNVNSNDNLGGNE